MTMTTKKLIEKPLPEHMNEITSKPKVLSKTAFKALLKKGGKTHPDIIRFGREEPSDEDGVLINVLWMTAVFDEFPKGPRGKWARVALTIATHVYSLCYKTGGVFASHDDMRAMVAMSHKGIIKSRKVDEHYRRAEAFLKSHGFIINALNPAIKEPNECSEVMLWAVGFPQTRTYDGERPRRETREKTL